MYYSLQRQNKQHRGQCISLPIILTGCNVVFAISTFYIRLVNVGYNVVYCISWESKFFEYILIGLYLWIESCDFHNPQILCAHPYYIPTFLCLVTKIRSVVDLSGLNHSDSLLVCFPLLVLLYPVYYNMLGFLNVVSNIAIPL